MHPWGNPLRIRLLAALTIAGLWTGAALPASAEDENWTDADTQRVLSDLAATVGTTAPQRAPYVQPSRRPAALRASAYDHLIEKYAQQHGISTDLVRAVIKAESAFNPYAISPKGAMGLMQLMPSTAATYGVLNPFDPEENIRAGVAYLKHLLDRYDQKVDLALAAYNAGPGAVDKYGETIPPYRETRNYVRKIISVTPISVGPSKVIYKIVELIDDREVPRYSDQKPEGDFEVVTRR